MKLATGIASLFIALASGIHAALLFFGGIFGDDTTRIAAYICAVMAALFLFGGALAFKEIRKSKIIFIIAVVVGLFAVFAISRSLIVWTVAAGVLVFLSDNAEPAKIPAA